MRIDARTGNYSGWSVYDCERCRVLTDVVWADDVTNEYGVYIVYGYVLDTCPVSVRKVRIVCDRNVVLINPLEDVSEEGEGVTEAARQL